MSRIDTQCVIKRRNGRKDGMVGFIHSVLTS